MFKPANDVISDKHQVLLKLISEKEILQNKIDSLEAEIELSEKFNSPIDCNRKLKTNTKYKIPIIFISGPFRGNSAWEVEQNIRKAEDLYLKVWQLGGAAICPNIAARFLNGALEDDNIWLQGELAILAACHAVVFVSGYEKSIGSMLEHDFAKEFNIPRIFKKIELEKFIIDFKKK